MNKNDRYAVRCLGECYELELGRSFISWDLQSCGYVDDNPWAAPPKSTNTITATQTTEAELLIPVSTLPLNPNQNGTNLSLFETGSV